MTNMSLELSMQRDHPAPQKTVFDAAQGYDVVPDQHSKPGDAIEVKTLHGIS